MILEPAYANKVQQNAVISLWDSWSAEERIQHFANADFDLGLFSCNTVDRDIVNPRVTELLQAYAEARPEYAPPREHLLDMLIGWVQSDIYRNRRPTNSPFWGEMMILRGN